MAHLDRYLKPLTDKRAEELHVYANIQPTYLVNQEPVKELEQLFTNEELTVLLEEIFDEASMVELSNQKRLNYHYKSSLGTFRCQARWSNGDLKVRFTYLSEEQTNTPFKSERPHVDLLRAETYVPFTPTIPPSKEAPQKAPITSSNHSFESQLSLPQSQASTTAAAEPAPTPLASPPVPQPAVVVEEPDFFAPFLAKLKKKKKPEIHKLFQTLIEERGSDLHLSSGEKPILRVDGSIKRLESLPQLSSNQVAQLLAPIVPKRNRLQYTELNDTDFAYEIEGMGRFRANIFLERRGICAVFRLIPSEVVSAEQLGLPKVLRDLCYLSKGLVLVTGPTGSGKSTTLCALIDLINRNRDDHIITIEDPIEFVHPSKKCLVNQREVGIHTTSFKHSLRAALREDPDIILVGELRDLETMSIAIETAETGHLVFGTLHTTSAIGTVDRLIDQFPGDRQAQVRVMLADSLKAVVSQTLLKKRGGGRIAAMEILIVTQGVSNLIREQKIHQISTIMQTSKALGMQSLNEVLVDYTQRRIVDLKEAYTKAVDKVLFLDSAEKAGIDVRSITSGVNVL